jgi:glycosyltransferase 2 family protein
VNSAPISDSAAPEAKNVQSKLSLVRLILPLALGAVATWYLFQNHFDLAQFKAIRWDARAAFWLFLAVIFLIIRHLAYMLRLRTLTGSIFSWRKTAAFVTLWEFSAAIAPTSKGGPFVTFFILLREGVKAGRATASLFYIMLLDSAYFVISLPIWWSVFGDKVLMPDSAPAEIKAFASGAFYVTFCLMLVLFFTLITFLFLAPGLGQRAMHKLASIPFLKKYSPKLRQLGDDFVTSALELRGLPKSYHVKAIVGTVGAWTAKFVMINCLILAVYPAISLDGSTQVFIYARLISMFIIMTFSPTPGGAGIAEIALAGFISDLVPQSIGLFVAILWRLMAYYTYLIAGAVVSGWYFSGKRVGLGK